MDCPFAIDGFSGPGRKGIVIRYEGELEDNCQGEAYNGMDSYKDEQDMTRRMEEHRYCEHVEEVKEPRPEEERSFRRGALRQLVVAYPT